MKTRTKIAVAGGVAAVAVAGTVVVMNSPTPAPAAVVVTLAVGPGPTTYVVQPQPAPGSCQYRTAADGQTLPDPACTPGATNPKVTPDTLSQTICQSGYTASIRPPLPITRAEKRKSAEAYSFHGSLADAEYDHLIPLELGGDPNDPRNLWVEPGTIPNAKDRIEHRLKALVCAGKVSLTVAQEAIATDWTAAAKTYGG